ncbi:hypothetical protein QL285_003715 [Trifolium repens]|nr:hypothetical protein QL285_003715 [Trifolium repens]
MESQPLHALSNPRTVVTCSECKVRGAVEKWDFWGKQQNRVCLAAILASRVSTRRGEFSRVLLLLAIVLLCPSIAILVRNLNALLYVPITLPFNV